ncbi:DNA adenine methylase [Candidatus Woesearchaeota archaeon]|nr:DNA adenine methylase [Candidatus Woesearchaeota archaeon]
MTKQEKIISPSTRYQGSKRRILPWLKSTFDNLEFETVLDGFGGTASVSYLFKLMGKEVTFNDILLSNYQTGLALIENKKTLLNEEDIEFILNINRKSNYSNLISKNYKNIYFLDEENKWLDKVINNIKDLSLFYKGNKLKLKKALAHHILFQSCLSKRPFNLFHRKNLNMRTNTNIKRSFGNKVTWDTPFREHFIKFNKEYSDRVFDNKRRNKAMNKDIFKINKTYDLVYLDPPYMRTHTTKPQKYQEMYHFLEGIMNYETWLKNIDYIRIHKPFIIENNNWNEKVLENFDELFKKFSDSVLVVSYGNKGSPSISSIVRLMKKYKNKVRTISRPYSYRLNRNNGKGYREVIIIGE